MQRRKQKHREKEHRENKRKKQTTEKLFETNEISICLYKCPQCHYPDCVMATDSIGMVQRAQRT